MPQEAWSDKDERQYRKIKKSAGERGKSEGRAEEIAAATVNKQRRKERRTKSGPHTPLPHEPGGRRGSLRLPLLPTAEASLKRQQETVDFEPLLGDPADDSARLAEDLEREIGAYRLEGMRPAGDGLDEGVGLR